MPNLAIRTFVFVALTGSAAAAQDTVFTWSKSLPAGARLAIRNYNGLIDVRPGTSDRIEVRATTRIEVRAQAKKLSFDVREHAADDVEICTVFSGLNVCDGEELFGDFRDGRIKVRYTIDLPKGMRLRASTGSGDVIVMQAVAGADVTTGSGDVVIRESESGLTASTGSGDVTVAAASGAVRASTGNGNVLVITSRGPVDASSGNGDVDVQMASVPPMPDKASMSITSGNGKVKVTMPDDFNGELDASTGNGSIKSDFDVRSSMRGDSRLRGAIGNGNGPLVRIHSGNGRVEIHKG
jgi:DUF4097 and DUF4098 domain-containing protein YvlB